MATHQYVHEVWRRENYRFVTTDERLNYLLRRLSVQLIGELRTRVLKEFEEVAGRDPPPLVEGAIETLEHLSLKYRMGIISDSGLTLGRVLRKVLSGHRVLRFFEVTLFSDGHSGCKGSWDEGRMAKCGEETNLGLYKADYEIAKSAEIVEVLRRIL